MKNIVLFWSFLLVLTSGCKEGDHISQNYGEMLFVHEVMPLFEAKCLTCHGNDPEEIEGGLDLRDPENLLQGRSTGEPIVISNRPEMSRLYQAVMRVDEEWAMPPKIGDALQPDEIEMIHDWIVAGAPWPDEKRIAEIEHDTSYSSKSRVRLKTSGGLDEIWDKRQYRKENLWAYMPLKTYKVPYHSLSKKAAHPIDAFLQAKRDDLKLKPSEPADMGTLLRRATFDLTGLPPTPEEMEAFLNDPDQTAFEKVIDRLLASPHYGEQWGRHWLDVVRYADSGGFSNDYIRPNAWRYRDYVIWSFNEDKPYNQFAYEQLAGDEMATLNPEHIVATGFLRMGPWEHTSMSVAAETRQFYLDDVTNIVGETFLATPLNCAKCHDHKYDPIPTRDYYQIQAVFAGTQFARRPAAFMDYENVDLDKSEKALITKWIAETKAETKKMADKEEHAASQWYKDRGLKYLSKRDRRKLPDHQQPPRYLGLTYEDLGYRKVLSKQLQTLNHYLDRFKPLAFSVYNGPTRVINSNRASYLPDSIQESLPPSYILNGGSIYSQGDQVLPGALSVLNTGLSGPESLLPEFTIPNSPTHRRSAFAQWLTHPNNPLFVRSIVNRVWQYHFGKGIAQNPNNFGSTGKKPTHPELLDWLCQYFIEYDWSLKELHRLIMTSDAYTMRHDHHAMEKLKKVDPDNNLLCHFPVRRLHAEELRDAMLSLSGELNPIAGGFPIRPEVNQEVALQPRHIMGSIAQAYQPSRTPEERNRRSIYMERYRSLTDPDLEVFNQPGSDFSCERRIESTLTTQAFSLLNSENTRNRALALANKISLQTTYVEEKIRLLSKKIWCREAENHEIKRMRIYIQEMTQYHHKNPALMVSNPDSVQREMFEEMTGLPFTYYESLDIYQNYIPDLKPWDVEPEIRALADLAVLFFNSNEFVYVY